MATVVTEPHPNGIVRLTTTAGSIDIELFSREAPLACRNFVQLALEGFYEGCDFFRIVPGFMVQTGDPSGTGTGGECVYDGDYYEDEFSQRLQYTRRGLVGSANLGRPGTNQSQFFITLDRTPLLNYKNTLFGRVAAGDTLFTVLKIASAPLHPDTEKPLFPTRITHATVLDNPFPEIVPRITSEERRAQKRAKRDAAAEKKAAKRAGKAHRNTAVLSFEDDSADAPLQSKNKIVSAHDVLPDPALRREEREEGGSHRGKSFVGNEKFPHESGRSTEGAAKKEMVASETEIIKGIPEQASVEQTYARPAAEHTHASPAAEHTHESPTTEPTHAAPEYIPAGSTATAPKRSLVDEYRAKYKKRNTTSDDLWERAQGIRQKAAAAPVRLPSDTESGSDDDDTDWMAGALEFRKDATLDIHGVDEYAVEDPLARNS